MPGKFDYLSQRVDLATGNIVPWQPPAPADDATQTWQWSAETARWLSVPTIAARQSAQWEIVKADRDSAIAEPKSTSVGLFDADARSQANLANVIALVTLAEARGEPAIANYTLATNERVSLTLEQLQTAALDIGAQVQALYDQGAALRQQIEATTDGEQLMLIRWPSNPQPSTESEP